MAGFFGIGDYTKEGKGVDKNAPKKRGLFAFFELFFRKFWRLIKLNLLYILACLPTAVVVFLLGGYLSGAVLDSAKGLLEENATLSVLLDLGIRLYFVLIFSVFWGMGPVTCGYTYVLRNYSREEHSWMLSDFWQHTKDNFKQSLAVWGIDILAFVVMFCSYSFYSAQSGVMFYLRYLILCIFMIYTFMHFYIYQMIITFKLSLKDVYRNSLLLALGKLPKNLLIFVVLAAVHVAAPYAVILASGGVPAPLLVFVLLEVLILPAFSAFAQNFCVYSVIRDLLLVKADPKKYGEAEENDEESVFSDEKILG